MQAVVGSKCCSQEVDGTARDLFDRVSWRGDETNRVSEGSLTGGIRDPYNLGGVPYVAHPSGFEPLTGGFKFV